MDLKKLKAERKKQWGNDNKVTRGWCRYRSTTFLEVVGAKVDRSLQCIQLAIDSTNSKSKKSLDFDAHDSLYDAYNYLGKLIELVEADPEFLLRGGMP